MSEQKAAVKNAADEDQVREGRRIEKDRRRSELNDLKAVLELPQGRRVLWRVLKHCKTFGSIWESSAKIHYNSGQQDVGHFIMAEIAAADEQAFLSMMREAKQGEMNV